MIEKIFTTSLGEIHYWTNNIDNNKKSLIFLPGLTADHRLFQLQMDYFIHDYNVLIWDAPQLINGMIDEFVKGLR